MAADGDNGVPREHRPPPPQRVAPFVLPAPYVLPERPGGPPQAVDAFRQTQFLLTADLERFREGAELQFAVVEGASGPRSRTHPVAVVLACWSRAFAASADIVTLATRGAYASVPSLARAGAEYVAAQQGLTRGEMRVYLEWLADTLGTDDDHKATEFELGRYFAGEALAANTLLRSVYRPASELGRPNFGATFLLTASESNRTRVQVAFGDRAFHLALAEISLGWALTLSRAQLRVVADAPDVVPITDELRARIAAWDRAVAVLLEAPARASVREVDEASQRRYIVENFRRTSAGAPKRMIL